MKRSGNIRTDPEQARAWQERSRERALERAQSMKKRDGVKKPSTPKKRKPLPARNSENAARAFLRNFGSAAYVEATRRERCLFCGRASDTVRCAHITEARGMGGAGGDVTATGPACHTCDDAWGQGSGPSPRRLQMLAQHGMTWRTLERAIAWHHRRYGHLYAAERAAAGLQ
jgi:hypothetical protein